MSAHSNESYLQAEKGLKAWLTTVDHKKIGLMYLLFIIAAFAIGGIINKKTMMAPCNVNN